MTQQADVVVIGAGVIGSAVAFELARSGRDVVCIDKGPAPGAGSTSASASIIRCSYSTLDAVLTAWEAAAMWHSWPEHLGVVDPNGMARFVGTGSLVFRTPGYDGATIMALWDDIGIPYERLDTERLRARYPSLDLGAYGPPKCSDDPEFGGDAHGELTAFYDPSAGYIDDPMLAAHNLANAARHHGCHFRFGTTIVEIERQEGCVAGVGLSTGESVRAPVVVNVAGPHSAAINRVAGVVDDMRIGHRPLRQEMYVAPAPDGFRLGSGAPFVVDLDLGQYFRPQVGGTVLVGGTESACDPMEWLDDADDLRDELSREQWETAMLRLARRMPGFGVPHRAVGVAALYDAADDWVPIYDRSSLDGFYLACATSGNQFKNAPIAGQFLRAIIEATEAGHDHDREPVQFRGERTGRVIDLGAFSRRRVPAVTSGTVMG